MVTAMPEREPRGTRRKRETRTRLLDAALRLMAEKGMEGVAINEITEAADVGFGSFYNHFESKEAIYAALVDSVFEGYADALDRAVGEITDPAEMIAASVRHTMLRARQEPLWGQFLLREGLSIRGLERGLGRRLLRDIQKGIAAGRFSAQDPLMSVLAVGGTVLAAIAADLQLMSAASSEDAALRVFALDREHLPERTAALLLRTLGLPAAKAERISRQPLPAVADTAEASMPPAPAKAALRSRKKSRAA